MEIKKVVVIGSGTMGSGIAAHLCNAGIPVTLLDLTTEISKKARERIHKSKPPLLIDKSKINNINIGNINDNFDKLKQLGSYMISFDKINKGAMIASKAFECPFFIFVVLIPDKRIFFWKISDEKGNYLMPLRVQSQKTPFNCAGGERIENVAYLPLDKMREMHFVTENYFPSL